MRPQGIAPRIAHLNHLANGLQKEQMDLIRDDRPFTRAEVEAYLDGVRRAINGLGRAAVALQQVVRRLEEERGGKSQAGWRERFGPHDSPSTLDYWSSGPRCAGGDSTPDTQSGPGEG